MLNLCFLFSQLSQIDDFSLISNIMDQSLFFAGSFGRLGFDFRTSLVVLFEDHVFDRLQECWAKAIAEFRGALDVPLFDSGDDKHGTKDVVRIGLSSVHFISSEPSHVQRIDNDYTPPRQLLGFPILVDFTNAVLSSLNNLRLCLITSLRIRMKKRFLKMTVDFAQAISDFTRQMNLEGLCNDGRERSKKSKGFIQAVESMIKVIVLWLFWMRTRITDSVRLGIREYSYPILIRLLLKTLSGSPIR